MSEKKKDIWFPAMKYSVGYGLPSTMKKKYAFLPVIAAPSLALAATVYAGVIGEFADLERAYVPALALTNQPTHQANTSSPGIITASRQGLAEFRPSHGITD